MSASMLNLINQNNPKVNKKINQQQGYDMQVKAQHVEMIIDKIKEYTGKKNQKDLAKYLGISPQAISGAKSSGNIPDSWFATIKERTGIDKSEIVAPIITGSSEPEYQLIRHYRQLAKLDDDILKEIEEWVYNTEKIKPGFRSWFRIEFQQRFPEFDEWKIKKYKKTG